MANQAISAFQQAPGITPATRDAFVEKERARWSKKDAELKSVELRTLMANVSAAIRPTGQPPAAQQSAVAAEMQLPLIAPPISG